MDMSFFQANHKTHRPQLFPYSHFYTVSICLDCQAKNKKVSHYPAVHLVDFKNYLTQTDLSYSYHQEVFLVFLVHVTSGIPLEESSYRFVDVFHAGVWFLTNQKG
uniref:Uncharacterized protein n=1 Tax=Trieres chinensis TaxID=1514140 RepID=A0A7S1ZXQ8_TRICV|mmetsp:Transcript_34858/g.71231  ORF Transcript_34858/g.71231 Transcript_34858/m.71231 type:complete len:105 (+) Transcript_34858:212-526(+)